jgi:hypothetical protein
MAGEYTQALVEEAIESFNFSDYGMDGVDAIKGEEWQHDLAATVIDALRSDPKHELLGPARDMSLDERMWARHLLQELTEHARLVRNAIDPYSGVKVVTTEAWAEQWASLTKVLDTFTKDVLAGRPITQITTGGGRLG